MKMKNLIKYPIFLLLLGAVAITISCSDDEGGSIIIDGVEEGSFQVADGFYIVGISASDTTVTNDQVLNDALIEGDELKPAEREGHMNTMTFLSAGSYVFADIEDQEISSIIGGSSSFVDSAGTQAGAYTFIETEENGASFSISEDGFYHIIFDTQESNAYLVKITSWGVIGDAVYSSACTSGGFNEDVNMTEVSVTADGASYEITNLILRNGTFKFRYNDNWTIGSYLSFTNFGGTLSALEYGGANISNTDDGVYTVTLNITPSGIATATATRIEDSETCAFNADTYSWGIIGAATLGTSETAGWLADKELIKVKSVNVWRGVFPMLTGEDKTFKFRTNEDWQFRISPGGESVPGVTIVDNTADGAITDIEDAADRNWVMNTLPGGYLYVVIETADLGETWTITFDEAEWALIGEGSPVLSWDEGNGQAMSFTGDLSADDTSVTGTGDFLTSGWKVFINQSFSYNLGGALDGTTALEFDNSTFNLETAGNYTISITTADGGVTYNATAASN